MANFFRKIILHILYNKVPGYLGSCKTKKGIRPVIDTSHYLNKNNTSKTFITRNGDLLVIGKNGSYIPFGMIEYKTKNKPKHWVDDAVYIDFLVTQIDETE